MAGGFLPFRGCVTYCAVSALLSIVTDSSVASCRGRGDRLIGGCDANFQRVVAKGNTLAQNL